MYCVIRPVHLGAALFWFASSCETGRTQSSADRAPPAVEYTIQLDVIGSGYDEQTCWVAPRVGVVPGSHPAYVLMMQKLWLAGSDIFFGQNEMRSDDGGRTWSAPVAHPTLARRTEPGGTEVVIGDFTPQWHAKSGKLLGTGPTPRYVKNADGIEKKMSQNESQGRTAYSVYDAAQRTWTPWKIVALPDDQKFFYASVGGSQRVDLPDGDILLPFHFKTAGESAYHTTVMRCSFDGRTLKYVEHGDELARPSEPDVSYGQPEGRQNGLFEPSLIRWRGRYYLTMRNDRAAYVATSDDGLHFGPVERWRFDDGADLGCYNTQQHWVRHGDGLFLVYTRRGANNDHVFRHRAPLFLAQVDPENLRVIRRTERVLVPEHGAGLGNAYGVTEVSRDETWVTTAECMHNSQGIIRHDNPFGTDNRIYAARILWKTPNRAVDGR